MSSPHQTWRADLWWGVQLYAQGNVTRGDMSTQTTARPGGLGALNVRRMSLRAYNTAVHAARAEQTVVPIDRDAWEELEASGVAEHGQLRPQWARALGAASSAPVQVQVTAHQGPVTFTTDIVVLPGVGLACTQRSVAARDSPHGEGREPVVELVAFAPELVWPVVRRVLPPHEVLRADPAPTPSSRRDTATVEDSERWQALVARADARVELLVTARSADGRLHPVGAHQWLVTDGQLRAVGPGTTSVTTLEPGALAHELIFLVTGAYDAAAADLSDEGDQ